MSNTDLILVSGATGNTGSGVASSLLAQGWPARALVRDEAKAAGLRAQGAQVVVADLDRPETLTGDLLDGVTGVYFVTWNGPTALQQSRNLLEAIKRSGTAPHIVRLSGYATLECRIISELARCEDELKASGLPWTILKPTFFMQNVMMAAPTVREQGQIYFDWGNGKAVFLACHRPARGHGGVLAGAITRSAMPAIDLATAKAAQGLITGHTGPVSSRTELPVPGEPGQDTGQTRLCGSMRPEWPPGISNEPADLNTWLMPIGTQLSSVPWPGRG